MQLAEAKIWVAFVVIVSSLSARAASAEEKEWCEALSREVNDVHRLAQRKLGSREGTELYEGVLKAYSHLLEHCPDVDRIETRFLRADVYFALKQYRLAAVDYESIVETQQGRVCAAAFRAIHAWSCWRDADGADRGYRACAMFENNTMPPLRCVRRPLDFASKMILHSVETYFANCPDSAGDVHWREAQIYQEFGMLSERDRALTTIITCTRSDLRISWRAQRVIKSSCPE